MVEREQVVVIAHDVASNRACRLQDFYGHLLIYVLVCTLLVVIDLVTGSEGDTLLSLDWAFWSIVGWGLGVAIQGLSVAFAKSEGPIR